MVVQLVCFCHSGLSCLQRLLLPPAGQTLVSSAALAWRWTEARRDLPVGLNGWRFHVEDIRDP